MRFFWKVLIYCFQFLKSVCSEEKFDQMNVKNSHAIFNYILYIIICFSQLNWEKMNCKYNPDWKQFTIKKHERSLRSQKSEDNHALNVDWCFEMKNEVSERLKQKKTLEILVTIFKVKLFRVVFEVWKSNFHRITPESTRTFIELTKKHKL